MVQLQAIAATAVGNACFLHSTVFPLMAENALAMSHLDPSEIIATPFPLYQLCRFVALSLVWNIIAALICKLYMNGDIRTDTDFGNKSGPFHVILMVGWTIGIMTIIFHLLAILLGVHPMILPLHTLVAACHLSFNMLFPVIFFMPGNYKPNQKSKGYESSPFKDLIEVMHYLFGPPVTKEQAKKQQNQSRIQYIHQYTAFGTIVGMLTCAIFRIFDHGMQIQRYPLPIIMGATGGSCAGLVMGEFTSTIEMIYFGEFDWSMFNPRTWFTNET